MLIEKIVEDINTLLTPKRLKYAWILGGALWLGWVISIIAGKGNTDLAGQLIGTDFVAFYTAGKILLMGKSAQLYDLSLAISIQEVLYNGNGVGFNPYLNPPLYALLMVPFALIPYPLAPVIWIVLGIACLWLGIKFLSPKNVRGTFFWSLTWFPVFSVASFGQNSFLTLAILTCTFFLWIKKPNLFPGLILSILLIKPQMIIGVGLLWLLDFRRSWKALIGLSIGVLIQIGLSLWLLPEASFAYISYTKDIMPRLLNLDGFPIWNVHSVQSFWLTLIPGSPIIANILFLACALIGTYYFIQFWRNHSSNRNLMFAAAILWFLLATPYICIYDWSLLLIPAVILWENQIQYRSTWIAVFAIIWLVTLISGPLTALQIKVFPVALQLSIPFLLGSIIIVYKMLMKKPVRISQSEGTS